MDRSATHWTADAWIEARAATAALLEELGLEGYLFEVEPLEGDRIPIRVEWVRGGPDGTWTTTRIDVDAEQLLSSRSDAAVRRRILRAWRTRFRAAHRDARPHGP